MLIVKAVRGYLYHGSHHKLTYLRSMWLYRHKFNTDGTLKRYKSQLVANGKSQQPGIDCKETISLVIKPASIRAVLHLAVAHDWPPATTR